MSETILMGVITLAMGGLVAYHVWNPPAPAPAPAPVPVVVPVKKGRRVKYTDEERRIKARESAKKYREENKEKLKEQNKEYAKKYRQKKAAEAKAKKTAALAESVQSDMKRF